MKEPAIDFQTAFNALPGNFFILKPDAPYYTILAVSDELLRIISRERQAVVGKSVFEVYPENPEAVPATGASMLRNSLQKAIKSRKLDQMPTVRYDVITASGAFEERYWSANNKPVWDSEGEVAYIIHSTTDITEQLKSRKQSDELNRKLAEEVKVRGELAKTQKALKQLNSELGERVEERTIAVKLAQAEIQRQVEVLHELFMQAPAPIAILEGENMVYGLVNPAYQQIFPEREFEGKGILDALWELKNTSLKDHLEKVYQTGETFVAHEMPFILARHQGEPLEELYFNFTLQARRNQLGEIDGILIFVHEVTEHVVARKKVEENQEALKRFKFMADQARDAFVLMREDGSFAYLNQKALEAWGYSEEEAQYLRVPDVDPVYHEELFLQLFSRAQHESIPRFETLHKRKDGEIFPVEVNVVGLNLEGKPYLFAIARDISERKKSEKAMELKNEQLLRINNDLDNFIYTASHDLKAPITNVEGLVQVLLRNLPAEALALKRVQQITGMMQESVGRFKKTIESLTDVVKLQKEYSGEVISVDLAAVVQEVQLDLEPMIRESGAHLEIDVAHCPSIRFPEKNLRSVVYNLLSNAIKYRSPERLARVEISCESSSEYQVVVVKDNGIGIRKRSLDQLFTMFKRFHAHVEGTGVGLYMVKKIVENAGGQIEVESQEGEGSTFRVYFRR